MTAKAFVEKYVTPELLGGVIARLRRDGFDPAAPATFADVVGDAHASIVRDHLAEYRGLGQKQQGQIAKLIVPLAKKAVAALDREEDA